MAAYRAGARPAIPATPRCSRRPAGSRWRWAGRSGCATSASRLARRRAWAQHDRRRDAVLPRAGARRRRPPRRGATAPRGRARDFAATRAAALLALARLAARDGDVGSALEQVQAIVADGGATTRVGGRSRSRCCVGSVAGTRPARGSITGGGRSQRAACSATSGRCWARRTIPLWQHLGADANRVLDLVDQYLAIGDRRCRADVARAALSRRSRRPMHEDGVVRPGDSPLVAIYRGFVRARLGGDGEADYRARASRSPPPTSFPARRSSYAVLHAALRAEPGRPARQVPARVALSVERARPSRPSTRGSRCGSRSRAIPTLHRNLGLTLLHDPGGAAARAGRCSKRASASIATTSRPVSRARPGAQRAGPAGARPRRRAPAVSGTDLDAVGDGVQAGAGTRRGRRRGRGRAPVPRSLLPARGGRHQRPRGVRAGRGGIRPTGSRARAMPRGAGAAGRPGARAAGPRVHGRGAGRPAAISVRLRRRRRASNGPCGRRDQAARALGSAGAAD